MHVLVLKIEWSYYVHGTNTIIVNNIFGTPTCRPWPDQITREYSLVRVFSDVTIEARLSTSPSSINIFTPAMLWPKHTSKFSSGAEIRGYKVQKCILMPRVFLSVAFIAYDRNWPCACAALTSHGSNSFQLISSPHVQAARVVTLNTRQQDSLSLTGGPENRSRPNYSH